LPHRMIHICARHVAHAMSYGRTHTSREAPLNDHPCQRHPSCSASRPWGRWRNRRAWWPTSWPPCPASPTWPWRWQPDERRREPRAWPCAWRGWKQGRRRQHHAKKSVGVHMSKRSVLLSTPSATPQPTTRVGSRGTTPQQSGAFIHLLRHRQTASPNPFF
jgi:hypothetical protein